MIAISFIVFMTIIVFMIFIVLTIFMASMWASLRRPAPQEDVKMSAKEPLVVHEGEVYP